MYVNIGPDTAVAIAEFDVGLFDSAQFDAALSSLAPVLRINAFNAIMEMGAYI
jgi:hypothetical protein